MPEGPRWVRWAVLAVVLVLAAGLRLWNLSSPDRLYWDEQYYVFDAEVYLGGGIGQPIPGAPAVKIADEGTWVHPPLGKWIIALLGVGPMGFRSLGWRLPSAVFGIAGVALLYLLALKLWGSVWWAGLSALLLGLDGLHIVQSRIAMLDVFMTTFVTAGMLLLVLDRGRMEGSGARSSWLDVVFGSPYRLGAGAAFGAAVATKWAGVLALLLGTVLCAVWVLTGNRRGGRSVAATAGTLVASFVFVPLAVYLVSYGAFFYQHGPAVRDFLVLQGRMFEYHQAHTRVQPESSLPWTWPLLLHPIQYFAETAGGSARRIVALGNPALWWGFLALLPVALVTVARRPTWRDAVSFGGYAAMYLPWLLVRRNQFFFYMLPAVPFMCLCVPATLRRLDPRVSRAGATTLAVVAAIATVSYLPVWIGSDISPDRLSTLRLLSSWPL
jgi:dolichyl-phosphate-mannose-protein mannosyltransferase